MPWGESDPFGLVYYPRMVAWFNDTEHELFRHIGYPIEKMIEKVQRKQGRNEIDCRQMNQIGNFPSDADDDEKPKRL